MHGFSYLRLAAWLAGPIAAARWIIGAIGVHGYLLLVVGVTVGSVIVGYDAMFGDGKPRTGDEARILLLVLPVAFIHKLFEQREIRMRFRKAIGIFVVQPPQSIGGDDHAGLRRLLTAIYTAQHSIIDLAWVASVRVSLPPLFPVAVAL